MKALILDGIVRDVVETEFVVNEAFIWVECDANVQPGYSYANGIFSAPAPIIQAPLPICDRKLDALWNAVANNDLTKMTALKIELGE